MRPLQRQNPDFHSIDYHSLLLLLRDTAQLSERSKIAVYPTRKLDLVEISQMYLLARYLLVAVRPSLGRIDGCLTWNAIV